MEKVDARKQSREVLQERRMKVIRLHLEEIPVMQIVERSGLSWYAVNAAIKKYKAGGDAALMPEARGKKQGTGRTLSKEQESEICQLIRTKRPWKCGLKNSLWDRDAVIQLIKQKYGIKLSDRGIGGYFGRWGLTLKDANKTPYHRCTKEVRKWLDGNYYGVEQQAQSDGAEIYWINKPVSLKADVWCDLDAKTIQPKLRHKFSVASVVNNQGKVCWMINKGAFNPDRQVMLAEAIIKDTKKDKGRKVFLIRCDLSVCRSRQFMDWLSQCNNVNVIKVFPDLKDDILTKG